MRKALLDTSTYLDIRRASRNRGKSWAQNTLRSLIMYRREYPTLSISAFTVFEILEGIYRDPIPGAAENFISKTLAAFEVFYPDQEVITMGAQINASLVRNGQTIGIVDSLIAATAIVRDMALVTSNRRHFSRIRDLGFPIDLNNWRE